DPELFERMKGAIVFFTLSIDQIEAKFKLSQNRQPAEIEQTLADLNTRNPVLAQLMRDTHAQS
ncbi:MAG: FMN-binding negative transcriptional regulator, partial [Pseudomonadota bacterium]|nr:FMN-binding negative transcriptional regulator [Pseudomonadota bacterium]